MRRKIKSSTCGVIAILALCVQGGPLTSAAVGAPPPVIESTEAVEVTDSNAALGAVIDPVEDGVYYQFQIAANPSEFASEILCPASDEDFVCAGGESDGVLPIGELWGEAQSVELDLNEAGITLQPESTYYFRVLAARAADEEEDEAIEWEEPIVFGETKGFTTDGSGEEPSVPPALVEPLSISKSQGYDLMWKGPLCRGERVRRRGRVVCVKPSFCRGTAADAALKSSSRRVGLGSPNGIVLLVDKRQVRAGRRVYARLANFRGIDVAYGHFRGAVTYGHAFSIERWTKDDWEEDPSSPDGPWPKSMGRLAPGEAGKCYVFNVPAEQPAGRYRFVVDFQLKPGTKFALAWRTAGFGVK